MSVAEEWRDIDGYVDRYQVSNLGRVKSLPNAIRKTELLMKPQKHPAGHLLVMLTDSVGGKYRQKRFYVHRLVLETFVGLPPLDHEACHCDGNPENNALSNLRWDTRRANQLDRRAHGTSNRGDANGGGKLTEAEVKSIKERLKRGEGVTAIAREYGVWHGAISSIKTGRNWGWL